MLELVGAFLVVGALAFGDGQAALPPVERLAVGTFAWVKPAQFAIMTQDLADRAAGAVGQSADGVVERGVLR